MNARNGLAVMALVVVVMLIAGFGSTAELGLGSSKSVALPQTAFGCYLVGPEITQDNWRANVKLMKQYGMDTFALMDVKSAERLVWILDIAIEEEMLNSEAPILLCIGAPEAYYKQLLCSDDEWAKAEKKYANMQPDTGTSWWDFEGSAKAISHALHVGKYANKYPEFVFYSFDEPGHGELIKEGSNTFAVMRENTMAWNFLGFRCGTSVCYPNVKNMVPVLDILAVNIIIGGDLRGCRRAIISGKKEFWVYDIHTFHIGLTPEMTRWSIGLWDWLVQPRVRLSWCWKDAIGGDMNNPKPTIQLKAYKQGVADYMLLRSTELSEKELPASLIEYRDSFDWEGFPLKEWVAQGGAKTAKPNVDFDKLLPKSVK